MRWPILKTLLHKEALRHATNRGGLTLAGLLVAAALLLAVLNPGGDRTSSLVGGVHHCYVHYQRPSSLADDQDFAWVDHLRATLPDELRSHVFFRQMKPEVRADARFSYDVGTGAIEIRTLPGDAANVPRYRIQLMHPAGDRLGMAPYETWFWRETYRYFAGKSGTATADERNSLWAYQLAHEQLVAESKRSAGATALPNVEFRELALTNAALDMRAAIATSLVIFALFFTCVYLMPSLNCEEYERGLLLAQALSPATTIELLGAKFLFYPTFGMLLAILLAAIHDATVLARTALLGDAGHPRHRHPGHRHDGVVDRADAAGREHGRALLHARHRPGAADLSAEQRYAHSESHARIPRPAPAARGHDAPDPVAAHLELYRLRHSLVELAVGGGVAVPAARLAVSDAIGAVLAILSRGQSGDAA